MYTRIGDRLFRPLRTRWSVVVSVAAAAAFGAGGCGGDNGGVEPASTVSIGLAGTGRGTVIGSAGGINCTNASGSGTASGTCQGNIENGNDLTLAASPASGSTFTGWSGNGLTCPGSAPCTITVSSSQTITATFDAGSTPQALTIVGGGAGTGSGVIVSDPAGIDCTISGGAAAATGCVAPFPAGTPVQLVVESGSLVGFGGACTGSTCSVIMSEARTVIATFTPDAQPTQLAFVVQPSAVQVGQAITPPVQVALQGAAGQTVAGRTDAVTLRIATNPGSATLGGQLTRNAVNGVATFADLTLSAVGDGYTLAAAATGLPEETSAPFNVSLEPTARLAFLSQPSTTAAGGSITPAVTVEVQDQNGARLTNRTDDITLSLQNNPGGGTLGGATTATAVAGLATFANLTLDKAATGYVLAAATGAAGGATSSAFDIVAGPPILATRNSSPGAQSAPVNTAVPERPSVKVVDAFNNPVPGVPVIWEVTAGGGHVVASTTDDVVRPTGPLGLSTAVSWTLGPEVGNENNELRATVDVPGINGSPITFRASGTIPPGQGIFTGTLKRANNTGIIPNQPIANANITFVKLTGGEATVGTTTSKSDGTFISPPLAAGIEYRLEMAAATFKNISFQKPGLNDGQTRALGDLGMVSGSDEDGQAGMEMAFALSDAPENPVTVEVEVYSGYYVGESDPDLRIDFFSDQSDQVLNVGLSDWGILTMRVIAEGYETQDLFLFFDNPNAFQELTVTLDPSPKPTVRR